MNPRLRRPLHALALLAMLLLATVPTLGRLAGTASGEAGALVAHRMAHHMPHGMAHAEAPIAPPHHQHDDDCAYCVLLGSAVPAVPLALAFSAPALPAFAMPSGRAPPQRALPRGRLGSRGPPCTA